MAASLVANVPMKSATVHATVIRKDGTIEHLGIVSYYHSSAICRALFRLERFVRTTRERAEKRS